MEPKITYSFQATTATNNNNNKNKKNLLNSSLTITTSTTTTTLLKQPQIKSRSSFSNMDDFLHRLKEKNSNLINILNNSSNNDNPETLNHTYPTVNNNNNNDFKFPNLNLIQRYTKSQKENTETAVAAAAASNDPVSPISNSCLKALLNKQSQFKLTNETASTLAIAAMNLTNAARISLGNAAAANKTTEKSNSDQPTTVTNKYSFKNNLKSHFQFNKNF